MIEVPNAQIDEVVFDLDGGVVVFDHTFIPLGLENKALDISAVTRESTSYR